MTSERIIQEIASKLTDNKVTFEFDDVYTSIKYSSILEECIELTRSFEMESELFLCLEDEKVGGLLARIFDKRVLHRNSERYPNPDFKWQFRDGSGLTIPLIFYREPIESFINILASHIAIELDRYEKSFETYLDYQNRFPENNDFTFDNNLFLSLRYIYTNRRARKGEFFNRLKSYTSSEFGHKWLIGVGYRVLGDLEKCVIGKGFKEAMVGWQDLYPVRYDDFPVQYFLDTKTTKNVFDFEVAQTLQSWRDELSSMQRQSADHISRVKDQLTYIKENHLSKQGLDSARCYDPEVLRKYTVHEYEGELALPFSRIRQQAIKRAAALYFYELEGMLNSGNTPVETKLNRQQFAVLGYLLSEMGIFNSNAAYGFLKKNFLAVDGRSGKPIRIDTTNLHKLDIPQSAIEFLKKFKEY